MSGEIATSNRSNHQMFTQYSSTLCHLLRVTCGDATVLKSTQQSTRQQTTGHTNNGSNKIDTRKNKCLCCSCQWQV